MKSQPRGSDVIAPHLHQTSNQELESISNRMFWNILGLMKVLIKEYSKSVSKKNPSGNIQKNCQYSKNLWVNNVQNLLALVCWAETRSPATPRYLNVIWTLFRNTPALFLRRRTDATFHWAPIQWSLRGSVQNRREASKRIGVQWRL